MGEAAALGNLGNVYFQRSGPGDPDRAEEHLKLALGIQRDIGDRLGEARDLGNLGNVYLQRGGPGDVDKAEEHHKEALEVFREIDYRLGEANTLGNLGIVYLQRGEREKARDHLEQAQTIYQRIGAGGQGPETVRRTLELIAELERQQQERGE